jgi:hypothetical protein
VRLVERAHEEHGVDVGGDQLLDGVAADGPA